MKLKDAPPMGGKMYDYDFHLLPKAKAVIEYLKTQRTYSWWRRKPISLDEAGAKRLDEHGYSPFLGWDSFVCRNIGHEVTQELLMEFRRVFGRDATLMD